MVRSTSEGRPGYQVVLAEFPSSASLRGGRHPVVVGVDGSASSRQALEWAVELAGDLEVEVIAVHASELVGEGVALPAPSDWWDALRGNTVHRAILATVPAVTALVEVCRAENAHCLVIGSDRRFEESERGRLLTELTRRAPCPVLVVPAREPEVPAPG